ncbi:NUDIX domain-containing protein [Cellulomonas sp. PhB150]|uniref:NUDIX domain-containing protein n=1 Tax=Cellulomonas sp. PhB150 TaxID=2485188 RepID=UPI000F48F36C|nr:NUDIX domain-containing protein [Cellulomonas sp. PhB150]ROS25913.1 putative NUDIX family NTP pyrophosphohydrolase [Cellulomonas sp. PhB150]
MPRTSAALLLYRPAEEGIEVLVGHMGGPFWARKEAGAWTIPKGEIEPDEDAHAAALREFAEEIGVAAPSSSEPDIDLGEIRQRSGKIVRCWARRGSLDVATIVSNVAVVEWPPRSGRQLEVPELDRAAWLTPEVAAPLLVTGQSTFLTRLATHLA